MTKPKSTAPKCPSCRVPYERHPGFIGTCAALQACLKSLEQIASEPRNCRARRNARATLAFIRTQVMCLFALLLIGCSTERVVIHDTVYNDYFSEHGWSKNRSEATVFERWKAEGWVRDYRVNERGEYANVPKDYPVVVEPK